MGLSWKARVSWRSLVCVFSTWLFWAGPVGMSQRYVLRPAAYRRIRVFARRVKAALFRWSGTTGREVARSLAGKDLGEKFTEIYRRSIFGGVESRSGSGSNLAQTAIIRTEIPRLMRELDVRSVLDAPCGDWFWMKYVDLGDISYYGIDIVDEMVDLLRARHGRPDVKFLCGDLRTADLPAADLILCRDCLVHQRFSDAFEVLKNFKRSGAVYLLTTTFPERPSNADAEGRFWAPLNLEKAPFGFPRPIRLINEQCSEEDGAFADKSLGLWRLADVPIDEPSAPYHPKR